MITSILSVVEVCMINLVSFLFVVFFLFFLLFFVDGFYVDVLYCLPAFNNGFIKFVAVAGL